MNITMEFDPNAEEEVRTAHRIIANIGVAGQAGVTEPKVVGGQAAKDAADKKAADTKKAADAKKAEDAAAAKKAEEDAAAAKKAEEEAAAAAAKKAEDEAAAGEDDDFLGGDGADEQPELTLEQVRQALTDYSKIEGRPAAIKILNEQGGVKSIGELPKDKFRAVYGAAEVKK